MIFDQLGLEGTDALLRVLEDKEHYGNHRIARMLATLDLDVSVWQVKVWHEVGLCYPPVLVPELQELRVRVRGSALRLVYQPPQKERNSA